MKYKLLVMDVDNTLLQKMLLFLFSSPIIIKSNCEITHYFMHYHPTRINYFQYLRIFSKEKRDPSDKII